MKLPQSFLQIATLLLLALGASAIAAEDRPNVIVVMTDDQGYGDMGHHGNPILRTPNLDAFARDATTFPQFYVSPVCSPTRASLMTGRYHLRTGVVDTYKGRSMMHADETTLAEMLLDSGYETGIFGKWHLGDNYPMRPQDQGFQNSLIHRGGGIGQFADPPNNSYFDPILFENGKEVKTKGYCTDVFTDAAVKFIYDNRRKPFFAYISYNAPHTPLQVPDEYYAKYKDKDLSPAQFPETGAPLRANKNSDDIARVYGMVENIDDNFGRLLAQLEKYKLRDNTIVIFLTDNGPQGPRFNAGLRDNKGSVFEGGIRVPFYIQWPAKLPKRKYGMIAAHIDIAPTVLDLCGVPVPNNVLFDGISLAPILTLQPGQKLSWKDRTLHFQWHRGDIPVKYRAFATRSQYFKLVQPTGRGNQKFTGGNAKYMLFDMRNDPYEQNDVAGDFPEIVEEMKSRHADWYDNMASTRGFEQPMIHLATSKENPSTLTRQDWRGPEATWDDFGKGHWDVIVPRDGSYHVTLRFPATIQDDAIVRFQLGDYQKLERVKKGVAEHTFKNIKMTATGGKLEAWVQQGEKVTGVHYVDVKRRIW